MVMIIANIYYTLLCASTIPSALCISTLLILIPTYDAGSTAAPFFHLRKLENRRTKLHASDQRSNKW